MVIVLGAVMMMVATTAVTIAVSGARSSKSSEDWNAALAAAYAGVDEYQNRLANDSTYSKYGNPASAFSSASGSTVTLPTSPENPAFGSGVAGTWGTVPGSDDRASFRYEVDNSKYTANGVLTIRSTGRVGTATRTVVADLKQKGFIDFLYFTDYEVRDPSQGGKSCTPTYSWKAGNSCDTIQFSSTDVMDGPMHSNDTLRLCGRFKGEITTANNKTPKNYENACSNPVFDAGAPKTSQTIGMPPTNAEMKRETRSDLKQDVPRPGCLYTGPTQISLNGATGKMTVKSPYTQFTNTAGDDSAVGSNPDQCGRPGTEPGGLGSATGATIDVVDQNLLYVQSVPSVDTDKNYTQPGTYPANFVCSNGDSNTTKGGWVFSSDSTVSQYPMKNEVAPAAVKPAHYGCRNGDVYVAGQLKGAMTIAAQNYAYVVGDLTYTDAGTDILGLVANAIWVWNPIECTQYEVRNGRYTTTCERSKFALGQDRTINAALLAVTNSFSVQNYDKGSSKRGTLTVNGAIAQVFRGPVATTGSSGYDKSYHYDRRLRTTAPPKFLSPTSTTYGVSQIGSVGTAFNADGSTP
ncbi:hypothetical protein [Mycetocola zhujimingii]|uniref:hypothetical protein n=1 Tax=Mycetocola zhujimingii TaxID=2079792 RepID=UPI001F26F3A8|nr:hypothetical protein [Mycetocola zhujimingii]